MSDSKVFMFPEQDRNNDFALWAALQNNQMNPMAMMGMMNGGMCGGMWNNPFIYLVWMMFAQRMWGRNGFGGSEGQDIEIQSQLSGIREQLNTNQNTELLMDAIKGNGNAIGQLAGQLNCDFNTLNSAICDVRGSIDKVAGAVGFSAERIINSVQSGDANLASQLAQCCCTIREAVTQQGYENQIATLNQTNVLQNAITQQGFQNQLSTVNQTNTLTGAINNVATGQERGFSSVAYETQRQTCDIQNSIKDATTQILEGQRAAEMRELQNKIDALRELNSQKDTVINNGQQTALFSQMIGQATAPIAAAVNNLQTDVNGIKCKLPETVTLPFSCATAVPTNAVFNAYSLLGGWANYNNNSLWG